MPYLSFREWTSICRRNSFTVSEDAIKKIVVNGRERGLNDDDIQDKIYDYLNEVKWENIDDSDILEEETQDDDFDTNVQEFVDRMLKSDIITDNLGDFE